MATLNNNEMNTNNTTIESVWKKLRTKIEKALYCEQENRVLEFHESKLAEFDEQIEKLKLLPDVIDLSKCETLKNRHKKEDSPTDNNEDDVILVPTNDDEFLSTINKEIERQRLNGKYDVWRLIALGMIYHQYKLEKFRKLGVIDLSGWNIPNLNEKAVVDFSVCDTNKVDETTQKD